jgi:hypothetical protein
VWCCPSLLVEVLSLQKPIYFLIFQYKNERIHLVIILNNWNLEVVFIWAQLFYVGAFSNTCRRRRSRSHHPHLHRVIRVEGGRRSSAVVARASHLLHTWGRRSGAMTAGASHLVAWGRRSDAARGRSKSPVAVSGLPLHELRVLANHGWHNVTKNSATCIIDGVNLKKSKLASNIRCKLKCIHNRIKNT